MSTADSQRAAGRISYRVKTGKILPPYEQLCWDCEEVEATEYDHPSYGPDSDTYVEPVCHPCHRIRHDRRYIEGTGNLMRPKTTAERARSLPTAERRKLNKLKRLYEQRLDASRNIVNAILECQDLGISYGIMGFELGVSAQNLQQLVKSYEQRQQQA